MISLILSFLCYFLLLRSKSEYLWLQASDMTGFRMVLRLHWTSKSSDFVKDILQKSTFQAMRIQDLLKVLLSGLWTRQGLQNEAHRGSQGQSWTLIWILLQLLDAQRSHHYAREGPQNRLFLDFCKYSWVFCQILCYFWNAPLLSWIQIQVLADV